MLRATIPSPLSTIDCQPSTSPTSHYFFEHGDVGGDALFAGAVAGGFDGEGLVGMVGVEPDVFVVADVGEAAVVEVPAVDAIYHVAAFDFETRFDGEGGERGVNFEC